MRLRIYFVCGNLTVNLDVSLCVVYTINFNIRIVVILVTCPFTTYTGSLLCVHRSFSIIVDTHFQLNFIREHIFLLLFTYVTSVKQCPCDEEILLLKLDSKQQWPCCNLWNIHLPGTGANLHYIT